jgi:hypothetical protein
MPLALAQENVAVAAAGVEVCRVECGGASSARLHVRNTGANALGAVVTVQLGAGDGIGSKAVLSTDLADANNDLDFTAVRGGKRGNAIQVEYLDPDAANKALQLTVVGTKLSFSLATNGAGAITTTAGEILAAYRQSAEARALVTAVLKAGNDGTGVVIAMAATNLATAIDYVADLDTATFASLAAGAEKQLGIGGPVGLLVLLADQGGGATTVSAWVELDEPTP